MTPTQNHDPRRSRGAATGPAPETLCLRAFGGATPAEVLGRFTRVIGRQPEPTAPWIFGPWFEAGGSLAERLAQVEKLRTNDAPLSVVQTYTHYLPCGGHVGDREAQRALTAVTAPAPVLAANYYV